MTSFLLADYEPTRIDAVGLSSIHNYTEPTCINVNFELLDDIFSTSAVTLLLRKINCCDIEAII